MSKDNFWSSSSPDSLKEIFLQNLPLIDVRAPVEFNQGHLPGAINLPILNDEERTLIGTTYKQQGNAAAVALGYQLISGDIKKSRVDQWIHYLNQNPHSLIYCFRGGQRSKISQQWISEAGTNRPRIEGGYKIVRQFLIDQIQSFCESKETILISGPTGSGKTLFLNDLSDYPFVDLEALAKHRGSAFGGSVAEQPSQANFENQLAVSLLQVSQKNISNKRILLEDESRMIGKCLIPPAFFERMRLSSVIWIDESLENRVEHIFQDYILHSAIGASALNPNDSKTKEKALTLFLKYQTSLNAISKKLGGLRTTEVMQDLDAAQKSFTDSNQLEENKAWIEKLLKYYYDPLYLQSLEKRKVDILFRGSRAQCFTYLNKI